MRFNLKFLFSLLAASSVVAYIDQPCVTNTNLQGVCVKESDCKMSSGQVGTAKSYPGFCLSDPVNVKCCVKDVSKLTTGEVLPTSGRCKNVSQCSQSTNTIYTNQCPGSANVRLCVPKVTTPTNPTTQHEVIDISYWNTITNYSSAANSIDGVLIRCGYRGYGSAGTLVKDSSLETHYKGFYGKTKIGYYFFSQAITKAEAEAEATYVVNTLLKNKVNDFPIYWDSEASGASNNSGRADKLSKATRTACAVAFVKKIQNLGYRAGVYASEYWFRDNLDFNQLLAAGASIWVAKYSSAVPSTSTYDAWQYTSTGSISGISGNVDKSHVYANIANW